MDFSPVPDGPASPYSAGDEKPRAASSQRERALSFTLSEAEEEWLAHEVPYEEQLRARHLLKLMAAIGAAPAVVPACRQLVARPGYDGPSWSRLRRLYYDFTGSNGGLHVLVRKTKTPPPTRKLPPEFIRDCWWPLVLRHQRCAASAHRDLVEIFNTRHDLAGRHYKSIPGYDQWPQADPYTGLPVGWTEANLRRHLPEDYVVKAARIGRAKATEKRLPVLTTRVGLRVGQFVQFDDHEFNQLVRFPGNRAMLRPLGFTAVDVATACIVKTSFKPTLEDLEEGKKKVLTETEFRWFVAAFITEVGYRTDEHGTTFHVERAKATIREDYAQRIARATGGHVHVHVGAKLGQAIHGGEWGAAAQGNPRHKALQESTFNVVDNYLDHLTGQTGKDRDHKPEQLEAAAAYSERIQKAADRAGLADPRRALLQFPFHAWEDWLGHALTAFRRINWATDHDIEGWEKMGFLAREWRLDPALDWEPAERLQGLPAADQDRALAIIQTQVEKLTRLRRLSRWEAWQTGRDELTRLPLWKLPDLVGMENAARGGNAVTVKNGLLTLEDRDIDPDPLQFVAQGKTGFFRNGEKFVCFLNPYAPEHLVAVDAKGRVAGVCPRYQRATQADTEALRRLMGLQNKWEGERRQTVRDAFTTQAAEKRAMERHNERVLNGDPVTPAEKRVAARAASVDLEEIPGADETPVAPTDDFGSLVDSMNDL